MTWLWAQYKDALGMAVSFWVFALIGVGWMFMAEPRQTAAKLCGSLAWLFTLLAILWASHRRTSTSSPVRSPPSYGTSINAAWSAGTHSKCSGRQITGGVRWP